jgi:UDP-glucuronate 4-epimerase
MKVLVTGVAGFIGSFVALRLVKRGDTVVGIDNLNDYYDPQLKLDRLKSLLGTDVALDCTDVVASAQYANFSFLKVSLEDRQAMAQLFAENEFDVVVNLAAQAGVRYSIQNPFAYIDSNLVGFANVLEGCRHGNVKHLVYASSSSVYGLNTDTPYQEQHSIAHPVSLYAATKKADELMAHAYSHLYNLPTTGLRFFTVYGPWGRPDMSPALFADAIFHDSPIKVFNNGDMFRDFTYVDDIVEGVIRVVDKPAQPDANWSSQNPNPATSSAPYRIYNIGNSAPVKLMDFIRSIEVAIGKDAEKIMMPMQSGDVVGTYADTSLLQNNIDFKPSTPLASGMKKYIDWYKKYYKL